MIGRPPFLWQLRQHQVVTTEPDNRKLTVNSIDRSSTINRPSKPLLLSTNAESVSSLVQVEQTQKEERRLAEGAIKNVENGYRVPPLRVRNRVAVAVSWAMILIGALGLVISIVYASTILGLIGLGLAFWGALLLFIRPSQYVRSDLMDSTALSSLQTIDRVMLSLGYMEKGMYIPGGNPDRAIVFIPAEPFSRIPNASEIEGQTFVKEPKGLAMVPPGLSLAELIEKELGVPLKNCSLQDLRLRLPKLLIEDMEMVRDFDMQVDGDMVRFKFVESIYSGFCGKLRGSTKVSCSMGCPICSAMACLLAIETGRPVSFEEDKYSPDAKTIESTYRILEA